MLLPIHPRRNQTSPEHTQLVPSFAPAPAVSLDVKIIAILPMLNSIFGLTFTPESSSTVASVAVFELWP